MSGHHHHPGAGPLEAITHVHGGAMVLDIGGTVGALHVRLDDRWIGGELVLATGDAAPHVHTGVWRRHAPGTEAATALFPALEEGTYHLLGAGGRPIATVRVRGGELTDVDLSDAARGGTGR